MSVVDSGLDHVDALRDLDWRHIITAGIAMYAGMTLATFLFLIIGGPDFVTPLSEWSWERSLANNNQDISNAIAISFIAAAIGLPFASAGAYVLDGRWKVKGVDPGAAIAGVSSIAVFAIGLLAIGDLSQPGLTLPQFILAIPLLFLYISLAFGPMFVPAIVGATVGYRLATDTWTPKRLALILALGVALVVGGPFVAEYIGQVIKEIGELAGL
jgi:hypothetical protein